MATPPGKGLDATTLGATKLDGLHRQDEGTPSLPEIAKAMELFPLTRRPRVPIPKGTSTNPWILEVFKRKGSQRLKRTTKRQGDGGTCTSAELTST